MTKKCVFTKSIENVNTAVIVLSSVGPVTVHVCDSELHRSLSDVVTEVTSLINQAQNLADTFGFDFREAISKGDLLSVNTIAPPIQSPPIQSPPIQSTTVPAVAIPTTPNPPLAPIVESAGVLSKAEVKTRVQSPHGRQFDIPTQISDEHGATVIGIDTDSENNFNKQWDQQKKDGGSNTSFLDSYNVQFQPCKLCVDSKTKQPTGMVNGQPCPKCKGAGEILRGR